MQHLFDEWGKKGQGDSVTIPRGETFELEILVEELALEQRKASISAQVHGWRLPSVKQDQFQQAGEEQAEWDQRRLEQQQLAELFVFACVSLVDSSAQDQTKKFDPIGLLRPYCEKSTETPVLPFQKSRHRH